MKFHFLTVLTAAIALAVPACGQDSDPQPPAGWQSQPADGGNAQRSGPQGFDGMGRMGPGSGITGTVTAVAANNYTIKTDAGAVYTVRFSSTTKMIRQTVGMRGPGAGPDQGPGLSPGAGPGPEQGPGQGPYQGPGSGPGQGEWMGQRGNSAQRLKPADIKIGDAVAVRGDVDETAKTIAAQFIVQLDPQRLAAMRQEQANFGKTWLQGKVTAIDGVKITLMGSIDNAPHTFVADENTSFRRRREPIALTDIQTGDMVRVEGAVKDGVFTAVTVTLMAMPQQTPVLPRGSGPQ